MERFTVNTAEAVPPPSPPIRTSQRDPSVLLYFRFVLRIVIPYCHRRDSFKGSSGV